jgi:branched-chain amino acid transport system substrate-binding protein
MFRMHAAVVLCTALLAPVSTFAAEKAIVVGQAIDLSGPNGSIGRDYVAGITTYFDSLNVRGGINGRKIAYIVRDDHGDPAESARLAAELIRQDRSDYLLGAIGPEANRAIVAAPAFADSRHVLFAPLSDSSAGGRARVLYWRPNMESEYKYILAYFDKLGIRDIGVAVQDNTANRAAFAFVTAEAKRRGLRLAGVAQIGGKPAELETEAQKLGASGAKLVVTVADTIGSAQFLRAFRKYSPATFVAGTSLTNLTTLREIAGARATEYTVFSQVVPNPESSATPLQIEHKDMMKKFRDEPSSNLTLEGFAVAKTLVKAIAQEAAGKGGLQAMAAGHTPIDLGGMTILSAEPGNNMSRYVDIALFKRDGGLMY